MAAPVVPILIGDRWTEPETAESTPVHQPSSGAVIARAPQCTAREVDIAVRTAREAFPGWARTPAPDRARVLFRYRELLEARFEELARLVVRENGKTREEARGDVRRGIEVVEFACGVGHLAKGEILPELARGIDGWATREPVGVCAGITPFNFPAMVPMWMYPLAIACGNSFVLKPSEKVPLTANRLAELFLEAGLPPGVFNVVHGGREVVEALCVHPEIAAVSFVGSSGVAGRVYELAARHGKRVQSAGGAKNVLLAMPDAVESGLLGEALAGNATIDAIMGSAFGCAGQRCMAGSLLMGVGKGAEPLREQVLAAMDGLEVGDTLADRGAGMGPVIDPAARQRLFRCIEEAPDQELEVARDGREGIPGEGFFVRPHPARPGDPRPQGVQRGAVRPGARDDAAVVHRRGDRLGQPHPVRQTPPPSSPATGRRRAASPARPSAA